MSPLLAPPLRQILEHELASGNRIAEVLAWPPRFSLLVILEHPFTKDYPSQDGIEFSEVNDIHYWKAQYAHTQAMHALACGFY